MNTRLKSGGVIECDDPISILYDKEVIEALKAPGFIDILKYADDSMRALNNVFLRPRIPFSYAKPKGWSTYQWVGFWNYAVLGTVTILGFMILHLIGVI